jgi:quinol monooxygenase YgiN
MAIGRREFVQWTGAAALSAAGVGITACASMSRPSGGATAMYGLVGKFYAQPGQRDALVAILLEGTGSVPGCLSYVVATDPADADAVWITEVWDSEASHNASLSFPSVKAAITKGKPLIARFGESHVTAPVGGHGLVTGSS